ncbi:hypothetical protein MKW92_009613 [Papaver armeniacum]|nr:hypothetical protein MKW92_041359 [Papaver armeniacum]KAI3897942.1 hypothetical protein MKW92_009613 [Papaver armeniacum]
MEATSKEMDNSYLFLIDMESKKIYGDEIVVYVEAYSTLVISYKYGRPRSYMIKKFDLPQDANLHAISAISLNGTLIISINKAINPPRTTRSIKVIKADKEEAEDLTDIESLVNM